MPEYGRTLRARWDKPCGEGRNFCSGDGRIYAGQDYARFVVFPNDENGYEGTVPWTLSICQTCATRYGREMPPRKPSKKKINKKED